MKDKDKFFKKKLDSYTVAPADELNIKKTILTGKQSLLQNPVQELYWYKRIFNQFKYISPLLWVVQLLAFGLCMFMIGRINRDTDITPVLSSISFIVAFIGVVGFPELCKSFSHQMWELEQSCKYNLRQIAAIKLSIIGMIDLLMVLIVSVMTSVQTAMPVWEMALYLFVPFNLVCIVSFFVISLTRNKSSVFPVFFAGFGVAYIMLLCVNRFSLYQSVSIPIWAILCLSTFIALMVKIVQFIKGMEEGGLVVWN